MKLMVFLFTLLLPATVFMLPDVLAHEQQRLIAYTNEVRQKYGLALLAEAPILDVSSDFKAIDMAEGQYFDHVSPDKKTLSFFLNKAGYKYETAGENLAMGFSSASEVIDAWVASPAHYANIIDPDFKQFGISLQTGRFEGVDTVYVAEHFGTPRVVKKIETVVKKEKILAPKVSPVPVIESNQVLGEKIIQEVVPPVIEVLPKVIAANSFLSWSDQGKSTVLTAQVEMIGAVQQVSVHIHKYSIPLSLVAKNKYAGSLTVPESSDTFFSPTLLPIVESRFVDGSVMREPIRWDQIKVVRPTPIAVYTRAQESLSPITKIFAISRGIYIAFAIFFSFALALSIFIEIRRQHYHIILQTLALILFIVSLAIV